ncbi:hypothetical protein QR98_0077340 [Sarcoptes scabiei]|uniref:Uncharacterized protein n=1 Tax=Sarcoptes scabiei TaxID=52283 RepID=A0A132ADY9_SARSC|nr:hypothetical protein QR98_0077340 [Sarcoptes scabiei]
MNAPAKNSICSSYDILDNRAKYLQSRTMIRLRGYDRNGQTKKMTICRLQVTIDWGKIFLALKINL